MTKRKVNSTNTMQVKITHPVKFGELLLQAGETATVPADLAREWISTERAISMIAEADKWLPEDQ